MRNIVEVIREKEQQLNALRREIETLKFVAPLLIEESDVKQPEVRNSPTVRAGAASQFP